MNYTQSIGCHIELQCMDAFIRLGYTCSIPYGNDAKYDFIADINGNLIRVQCKSPQLIKDSDDESIITALMLHLTNQTTNTIHTIKRKYTENQIDYFATYYDNKTYVIPVRDVESSSYTLRLLKPKNNNYFGIHMAEDYEISKYFIASNELDETRDRYLEGIRKTTERNKSKVKSKATDKINNLCKKCGKIISKGSVNSLCSACFSFERRKVERPPKEELENLIYTKPFTTIGKMFGVDDNSIRKWCKAYGLPYRKKDIIKNINSSS